MGNIHCLFLTVQVGANTKVLSYNPLLDDLDPALESSSSFLNIHITQYKLEPTPEPSDEEEDSSEEEEEAFGGAKKKKEEEDPAASEK